MFFFVAMIPRDVTKRKQNPDYQRVVDQDVVGLFHMVSSLWSLSGHDRVYITNDVGM